MKKFNSNDPAIIDQALSIFDQHTPLTEESKEELRKIITIRSYRKHDNVFKQDEFCDEIYTIINGSYRLFHKTPSKEYTTWLGYDHHVIGSLHSILLNTPARETMHILEESIVGVMKYNDFLNLSIQRPDIERLHRSIMSIFIVEMQENLFTTRFMEAADRYYYFIQKQPEALQRIPLTYLASFLGITKESLSRIRSSFKNNRETNFGIDSSYLRIA